MHLANMKPTGNQIVDMWKLRSHQALHVATGDVATGAAKPYLSVFFPLTTNFIPSTGYFRS